MDTVEALEDLLVLVVIILLLFEKFLDPSPMHDGPSSSTYPFVKFIDEEGAGACAHDYGPGQKVQRAQLEEFLGRRKIKCADMDQGGEDDER